MHYRSYLYPPVGLAAGDEFLRFLCSFRPPAAVSGLRKEPVFRPVQKTNVTSLLHVHLNGMVMMRASEETAFR